MDFPIKRLTLLSNYISLESCDAKGWDTGSVGQWDDSNNSIKIKNSVSPEVAKLTACHEVGHAIESFTGISLTEEQIQALGLGWYSFIKENKTFVKWLQGGSNE